MATIRISQLTAVSQATDDDVFIINDADTNTRKITFANLTQGLLNTSATSQTKNGPLSISGLLSSTGLAVKNNVLFVDSQNNRVGIKTNTPNADLDVNGVLYIQSANPIQFGDSDNSNFIGLRAPSVVNSNFTFTLPPAPPASTELVTSSSAGVFGFTTGIVTGNSSLSLNLIELINQGVARFYESASSGTNHISFTAPNSLANSNSYTLPTDLPPSSGFILASSTTGQLSWVSSSTGAIGANNQVQFATDGLLNSSTNLTFVPNTNTLTTVNGSFSGSLGVQGNVQLGQSSAQTISVNGVFNTHLLPEPNTYDLGSTFRFWRHTYTQNLTVSASFVPNNSNLVNLGSTSSRWQIAYLNNLSLQGVSQKGINSISVAGSGTSSTILGTGKAYKVLINSTDSTTGDVELFEQLVVCDNSGNISEVTGSNVQSPTPGNFLITASSQLVGSDIVMTFSNASTNTVSVKLFVVEL